MPLYLCRWPNGDFSIVWAPNKTLAIETLDELDNAEGCPISAIRDFMAHFRLTDEGAFEFEGFGEETEDAVWRGYPVLDDAVKRMFEDDPGFSLLDSKNPEQAAIIEDAVQKERKRVVAKKVKQPATHLGREIQRMMDAPTSLIEQHLEESASEILEEFDPDGKPN